MMYHQKLQGCVAPLSLPTAVAVVALLLRHGWPINNNVFHQVTMTTYRNFVPPLPKNAVSHWHDHQNEKIACHHRDIASSGKTDV